MLTKILSVAGRPGLYKLISTNKNMNVVESLSDGKRIPVYMHEKIVALSDVSIYTNDGDTPLVNVLKNIKDKEEGKQVEMKAKASGKDYFNYLEEVLPDYNKESVYASDAKKIISWYNILIENNIEFEILDNTEEQESEEQESEDQVSEEKDSKEIKSEEQESKEQNSEDSSEKVEETSK